MYAASRGVLEMIEILKVKREFLYLLLTLTQEKNVKVSRFPLIHLDETILAHTNLAEFHKFLQEKENEALLDRMVIIKVPYTLSYKRRGAHLSASWSPARRRSATCTSTRTCCTLAAVFAILTRLAEAESAKDWITRRSCASTPARTSRASRAAEVARMRAEDPGRRPDRRVARASSSTRSRTPSSSRQRAAA